MTMKRLVLTVAAVLATAGCENGGATRTLGVAATGVVRGRVYFDLNGSRTLDAEDVFFGGARIRVMSAAGGDTLFRATTSDDGLFLISGVPVGSYSVVIDPTSGADSAEAVDAAPRSITLLPGDSADYVASLSYPSRTTAEARALAPGSTVFIRAIALHARTIFSDTTLHVIDTAGTIRVTRLQPSAVAIAAGDSLVLRGRVGERLGQRVLDGAAVYAVAPTLIPSAPTITTQQAATGGTAGALDAALVRILNAQVVDTSTVAGQFQMTMNDGSGAVVVILDRAADLGFRAPLPPGVYLPTRRFDVGGILVPTGTGAWRLKPRSSLDLTAR
ncbi:MAG: hypothetical protein IT357_14010 [Gemmatimonadaceae bacterium]|nr:hypothetical protein [Gemmatimonadaceae bacterium]